MLGKEDDPGGGDVGNSQVSGGRKIYWRSASWSSSRSSLPPLNPDSDSKDGTDPNGKSTSHGQGRRIPPPLTPRQSSFKARSCLPPLSIARRSLDEWPKAGSDDIGEWPLPCTPSGNGGDRLKLDLSNIQKHPDKNCGGLVKREKIAFFDKECSKVAEHIYLGGDAVARDKEILRQHGITHILNCVGFVCPEYFKADFVYRTLWLQDSPSEDITSILYDVFDYFEDVREQGGRVLVHCCQGVSRSTSLVIAYLMWREGQSFDDAFQYVKAARGIADPNMGFACQLLQCQKRVHAFPLSPSSLLRMYRIAPHSPYDPLHLVPKMLNDPSPSLLDSRGAFIVHIPSAIYVWIGKNCEALMERDARGAVCQIVRYEKVQGPILMIKEGEEPSYFWDAFSNLLPLMEKSCNGVDVHSAIKIPPGQRKIESFDVDFEIFQKATIGGFVPPFASSETEHETHLPMRESCWSGLRRKFVSGNLKEFVSASKFSASKVYPDSLSLVMDSTIRQLQSPASSLLSSNSMSSSASSSSCSPPYLSPDSMASDSSNRSTDFSDSPAASPLTVPSNDLASSCLSNFSNMSLRPSKISPHSISKSSKYIDVNFTSQPSLHSGSLPSKKSSPSIAERRGSLSKGLKLPLGTDHSQGIDTSSCCLANEHDRVSVPYNSSSVEDLNVRGDNFHSEGKITAKQENCQQVFLDRGVKVDSSNEEASMLKGSERAWGSCRQKGTNLAKGMIDSGLENNLLQPVVCRWPSLERLRTFGSDGLDSNSVFILISPSSSSGNLEDRVLYIWVGRSFDSNRREDRLCSTKSVGGFEEIDWKQASADVVSQMGLPKDIRVEVIKENEEPRAFLALLSSL